MGILRFILSHRRLIVTLHLVFALAMLPGIVQLENDNSPEVFFTQDALQLKRYQQFRQDFGGGKTIRIALSGGGLWTNQGLAWLGELEERASALPGVETALGLAAHHRWLLLEWPPADPGAFHVQVLENGVDAGAGWVSPDGDTITLLVVITKLTPPEERTLLNRLDELVAQAPQGIQAHISGFPVLHRAMDQTLTNIAKTILPFLVLLAVTFLAFIFRRLWDIVIPLLFVAVCQGGLFGIMGYSGVRVNLVNIVLAFLIFVISLATAVHIQVRFRDLEQRGMNVQAAVVATYRSKGWAVLWTGITTLVAFGSLVTGNMPPVRSLGIWSAIGIALMTLFAFTFYPALLACIRPQAIPRQAGPYEVRTRRMGKRFSNWAIRRRRPVLVFTVAVLAAALLGLFQFRVEDNPAKYLSSHHPVRMELERLQKHKIGVFSAELVLSYRNHNKNNRNIDEMGFQDPTSQQRLVRLSDRLRSLPLVYGAVSSGDLVEATVRSILVEGDVNDNIRWMALGMMQSVPEGRKVLQALLTADGQITRVTLLVPMLSYNQMQPVFQQVMTQAASIFPDAEIWITGQYPLILQAQRTLLRGLIVSLTMTLLCVMLVFSLLLRSLRLTFLALIPNVWPIVLLLGGIGWLNLPLNSVSVMTASIVLGLAVDDTLHTLGYFLRLTPRCGPTRAIISTLERTAPAHVLTTVILAAGFIACAFTDFQPVSQMGSLATGAIFLALLGDLLLIPALLAGQKPR